VMGKTRHLFWMLPALLLLSTLLFPFDVSTHSQPLSPGLHPDEKALPPDLTDYFTEEEIASWKSYRMKKFKLSFFGIGSVLLFYLIFLAAGLNKTLKVLAEKGMAWCHASPFLNRMGTRWPGTKRLVRVPEQLFGGKEWLVVIFYCILFIFLIRLFFLPYSLYRSYWFETHEGLSTISLSLWFLDWLKGLLLGTLVNAFMAFGIYGLLARVGKWWWVLLWGGVSLAIFVWVMIVPYRSQLYSNFHSLEEGELRTLLETFAAEQGVELHDILVVDASRRTRAVNAYVQGTGPTQRLVLYDTLLNEFSPREIVMVFAHELVHWKEPHKKSEYLLFSATVFCILFLASRILEGGSRLPWLHYSSSRDIAGLPVLLLTFFLIFLLLRPVNLVRKRAHELETDRKSLEIRCDPEAFIQVHVKLSRLNYSFVNPHPLFVYMFFSHPPFLERVESALQTNCEDVNRGSAL